jgi:hypothetical protein
MPGLPEEPSRGRVDDMLGGLPAEASRQREAERQQRRDQEVLALLDHAGRLEARAAALRAQACKHPSAFRQ